MAEVREAPSRATRAWPSRRSGGLLGRLSACAPFACGVLLTGSAFDARAALARGHRFLVLEARDEAGVSAQRHNDAVRWGRASPREVSSEGPPPSVETPNVETLVAAAAVASRVLEGERIPYGPAATDLAAWLGDHAFYFLPAEEHEALRTRLSSEALGEAVARLRARLSSPVAGFWGDDLRRDPLGLRELTRGHRTHPVVPPGTELTEQGDLMARTGDRVAVQLQGDRAAEAIEAEVEEALVAEGLRDVRVAVFDPEAGGQGLGSEGRAELRRVAGMSVALMAIVLGLVHRRLGVALGRLAFGLIVGGLAYGLLGVGSAFTAPVTLVASAWAMGLVEFRPLEDPRQRWALGLAASLCGLGWWLTPYEALQESLLPWAGLVALVTATASSRVVGASRRVGAVPRGEIQRARSPVWARALVGAGVLGALVGGGVLASRLPYQRPEVAFSWAVDRDRSAHPGLSDAFVDAFFDPSLVATARSVGDNEIIALDQSVADATLLAKLVGVEASFVRSPGLWFIEETERARRQRGLLELEVAARMIELRELFERQGFRPDAFREFLDAGFDLRKAPTASALREGPLSGFVAPFLAAKDDKNGFVVTQEVLVDASWQGGAPRLQRADGTRLVLEGPGAFVLEDEVAWSGNVVVIVAFALWLFACVRWLLTRDLVVSGVATICGAATVGGVIVTFTALELPGGPQLAWPLVWAGLQASRLAAQAYEARATQDPTEPGDLRRGMAVVVALEVAAALGLMGSAIAGWSMWGAVWAIGSLLGAGLAWFAAPVLSDVARPRGEVRAAPGGAT